MIKIYTMAKKTLTKVFTKSRSNRDLTELIKVVIDSIRIVNTNDVTLNYSILKFILNCVDFINLAIQMKKIVISFI